MLRDLLEYRTLNALYFEASSKMLVKASLPNFYAWDARQGGLVLSGWGQSTSIYSYLPEVSLAISAALDSKLDTLNDTEHFFAISSSFHLFQ